MNDYRKECLYFRKDNELQNMAKDFLLKIGRKKTEFVTKLITDFMKDSGFSGNENQALTAFMVGQYLSSGDVLKIPVNEQKGDIESEIVEDKPDLIKEEYNMDILDSLEMFL